MIVNLITHFRKLKRSFESLPSALVIAIALTLAPAGTVSAESTVLAGSGWLGGTGVDIKSGGDGTPMCVSVTGAPASSQCAAGSVYSGDKWQCVEMVNRLFLTKGWITGTWGGNGNQLGSPPSPWTFPAGLVKQENGAISYINPGDAVSMDDGSFGHANIIDNMSGTTINLINQNAELNSSAYIYSGSLAGSNAFFKPKAWAGYSILSVIHHPASTTSTTRPHALQYNSEMDVFKKGGDTAIWKDTWNGTTWSGWSSMGGGLSNDPMAVKYNTELDVFATATNGQVVKKTWNGTAWSGWNSLGPSTMTGRPYALQYNNELTVFARGTDNHLYKDTWNGTTWSGWSSMGNAVIASSPTAVQYNTELDVVVRGGSNDVLKNTWNGSAWSGLNTMGGIVDGDPVVMKYNNELQI